MVVAKLDAMRFLFSFYVRMLLPLRLRDYSTIKDFHGFNELINNMSINFLGWLFPVFQKAFSVPS